MDTSFILTVLGVVCALQVVEAATVVNVTEEIPLADGFTYSVLKEVDTSYIYVQRYNYVNYAYGNYVVDVISKEGMNGTYIRLRPPRLDENEEDQFGDDVSSNDVFTIITAPSKTYYVNGVAYYGMVFIYNKQLELVGNITCTECSGSTRRGLWTKVEISDTNAIFLHRENELRIFKYGKVTEQWTLTPTIIEIPNVFSISSDLLAVIHRYRKVVSIYNISTIDNVTDITPQQTFSGFSYVVSVLVHNNALMVGDRGNAMVLIYENENDSYQLRQILVPPNLSTNRYYGESIAVYGDTLVVSQPDYDSKQRVYLYEKKDGNWTEKIFLCEQNQNGYDFGRVARIDAENVYISNYVSLNPYVYRYAKDINECLTNTTGCHEKANCVNTPGSYNCACGYPHSDEKYYQGNGSHCKEVCPPNTCPDSSEECYGNATAGWKCRCASGYEEGAKICEDINECTTGRSDCHPDATCFNTIGSYRCTCKPGFFGNGKNVTDGCQDQERIATEVDYQSAVSVDCDSTKVVATVDPGKLKNLNIVSLSIGGCSGSKDYNVTNYQITSTLDKCSHNVTETDHFIIKETTLILTVGSNDAISTICRGSTLIYILRCRFERRINVSTGLTNVKGKEMIFIKDIKTNFTVEMVIHVNEFFDTRASLPLEVTNEEPIYISLKSTESQNLLKFIVEDCFATPTPDPQDTISHVFFRSKCAMDRTFKAYDQPNSHGKFCFKIDAFQFIQLKSQVFFHCRLLLCKNESNTPQCTQQCAINNRRRRSVEDEPIKEVFVNSGAIIFKRKATCKETACQQHSRCFDLHPAACRCNEGYVYDYATQTCASTNNIVVFRTNLHIDEPFLPSYNSISSNDFLRLARYVENELMTSYNLNYDVIKGVKITGAKERSVVLDVIVLHSSSTTSQEAFDYFVEKVFHEKTSQVPRLKIKRHVYPVFLRVNEAKEIKTNQVLILSVAVPFVATVLIFVVVVVFLSRSRGSAGTEPKAYDNRAVAIVSLS